MRQTNVRGSLSLRGFRKLRTGAIVATGVILLGLGFLAPTVSASEQDGVWVARTVAEVKADLQKEGDLFKYVIKWGDTLSVISEASNIPVDVLQEMNQASGKNLFLPHNELYFTEAETVSDTVTKHKIVIKESGASGEVRTYEVLLKKDKETKAVTFELTDVTEKVEKMAVNYSPVYQPVSAPVVERAKESGEKPASEAPAETSPEVKEATEAPAESTEAKATEPEVAKPATPKAEAPTESTEAKATEPEVANPATPKTEAPVESTEAKVAEPEVANPATPKTEAPVESTEAKATEPEVAKPEVAKPVTPKAEAPTESTEAKATEPEVAKPAEAKATEPEAVKPATPKAEAPTESTEAKVAEPEVAKPAEPNAETPTPKVEEPTTPAPKAEEPVTPAPKEEKPSTPAPKAEEPTTPAPKTEEEKLLEETKQDSIRENIDEVVNIKLAEIEKIENSDEKEKLKAKLYELRKNAVDDIKNAKDEEEALILTEKHQNIINSLKIAGEKYTKPNFDKDNLSNGRNDGTTIEGGSTAIGHGSGEAPSGATQPASAEGTDNSSAPTAQPQPSSTSEGTTGPRNAPSVQARARRVARSTSEPDGTVNISYNFAGMPDIHGFLSDPGENNTVTIPAGTSEAQAKELVKEKIQAKIKDLAARRYHVKNDIIFEQDTTVKNYNYVVTFTKEVTGTSGFRMAPAVQPRASRNRRSIEQPAPQKVKVNVFYNFDQMKDIAGFLGDINGTPLEVAAGSTNEQVKAAVKSQVDAKKEELRNHGYTFKEDYVYQANGKDYNYVVTFSKSTK
ncbi:hypothetical protein PCY12_09495 [Streptococcus sp. SPS1]|uniref:LysM peptidoglycan-binding domain-containing protein n=1 Tax=Streptococcus sp. SPS1 TaxID=3018247 RepID=UPI00263E7C2B|nr:LysM peptidoglycan-binding domain-containing protein [Streptococcus sp. SPS1]MDN5027525.1 hypothetical protein [Streptococcus sp. SPS1]